MDRLGDGDGAVLAHLEGDRTGDDLVELDVGRGGDDDGEGIGGGVIGGVGVRDVGGGDGYVVIEGEDVLAGLRAVDSEVVDDVDGGGDREVGGGGGVERVGDDGAADGRGGDGGDRNVDAGGRAVVVDRLGDGDGAVLAHLEVGGTAYGLGELDVGLNGSDLAGVAGAVEVIVGLGGVGIARAVVLEVGDAVAVAVGGCGAAAGAR